MRAHLLDRDRGRGIEPPCRQLAGHEVHRIRVLVGDVNEDPSILPFRFDDVGLRRASAGPGERIPFTDLDDLGGSQGNYGSRRERYLFTRLRGRMDERERGREQDCRRIAASAPPPYAIFQ